MGTTKVAVFDGRGEQLGKTTNLAGPLNNKVARVDDLFEIPNHGVFALVQLKGGKFIYDVVRIDGLYE